MKELPILVLLYSAVLLSSAAPVLEPVTCSEDSRAAMARLAMFHINEHHDHGYKFKLNEIQGNKVEKADNGCNVELLLDLLETKCHVVNPQHFEDCELRRVDEREVMANCTVMMTVKNSDAKVTKYDCDTRQVKTNMEMMMICPDCPTLISLDSPEGIKSVNEGVKKFNQNTTNQRYYILQEVGRISSAYMMATGMSYFAEFALVETHCPMGSRIIPEACKPLCPDRAQLASRTVHRLGQSQAVHCVQECIMLFAVHLIPVQTDSSLLSVNSIPHRTVLPLALVNRAQVNVGIVVAPHMLAVTDTIAILTVTDTVPMLAAMSTINMLVVTDTIAILAVMDATLMLAVVDPLPTLAAVDPLLMMPVKDKTGKLDPLSIPTTASNPSFPAMDSGPILTQLSTPFAPGLTLKPTQTQN